MKSRILISLSVSHSLKFLKLFDELLQGLEAILASGHMGVIVQLAESCAESEEKQEELMQCLLHVSQNWCCERKKSSEIKIDLLC